MVKLFIMACCKWFENTLKIMLSCKSVDVFLAIIPLCLFTLITSYQIHVEVHWLYSIRVICYVLSYFRTDRVLWEFHPVWRGSFLSAVTKCLLKKGTFDYWGFLCIILGLFIHFKVLWGGDILILNWICPSGPKMLAADQLGSRPWWNLAVSSLLLCKESGMLKLNTLSFFCVFFLLFLDMDMSCG